MIITKNAHNNNMYQVNYYQNLCKYSLSLCPCYFVYFNSMRFHFNRISMYNKKVFTIYIIMFNNSYELLNWPISLCCHKSLILAVDHLKRLKSNVI